MPEARSAPCCCSPPTWSGSDGRRRRRRRARGAAAVRSSGRHVPGVQHMAADAHVQLVGARNALWARGLAARPRRLDARRVGAPGQGPRPPEAGRGACEVALPDARRAWATPGSTWPRCACGGRCVTRALLGDETRMGGPGRRAAVSTPPGLGPTTRATTCATTPPRRGSAPTCSMADRPRRRRPAPTGTDGWPPAGGSSSPCPPTPAAGAARDLRGHRSEELGGRRPSPSPAIGHLAHGLAPSARPPSAPTTWPG